MPKSRRLVSYWQKWRSTGLRLEPICHLMNHLLVVGAQKKHLIEVWTAYAVKQVTLSRTTGQGTFFDSRRRWKKMNSAVLVSVLFGIKKEFRCILLTGPLKMALRIDMCTSIRQNEVHWSTVFRILMILSSRHQCECPTPFVAVFFAPYYWQTCQK